MSLPQGTAIFAQIRNARSHSEQAAALRSLKNDITGHLQRKEKWVESGVLEPIVKILQTSRAPASQNGRDFRGAVAHARKLSDEEQVRLQALQLLAIFANGGPSFLYPIQAADAIPAILSNISPLDNPPQIVVTALRALSNITEAVGLAAPSSLDTTSLAELVFNPLALDAFHSILGSESVTAVGQEQKRLVAGLIGWLCRADKHQNALANYGILDALATMLASFVVARGEVVPGAEQLGRSDGMTEMIPDPAPPGSNLAAVLEAISAIISESRFRTCMLIYSPAIMAVLPNAMFSPVRGSRTVWHVMDMAGLTSLRKKMPEAIDYLLPVVPIYQIKSAPSQMAQFPPLGFSASSENLASNGRASAKGLSGWDAARFGAFGAPASNGDADLDEAESPLIPWLIHLVRSTGGLERVMAASVLASLFKAGFASPDREAAIGNLVVPVLCRLIKETMATSTSDDGCLVDSRDTLSWAILERAPTVLARLIAGSELLQVCAYDCGAIKTVCKLLVESYEPMPEQSPPRPWSPDADVSEGAGRGAAFSASRMGKQGHVPLYSHRVNTREAALKLIAAMIPFKEEIRMGFVEQDVMPYVAESLSPSPAKPRHSKERAKPERGAGGGGSPAETSPCGLNPNSVIIAACHVIRLLSRSISILRTSLEDHGVVMPIFKLLRHSDKDVQVASCAVSCNLVLEMSPMRQPLIELGIVKILCEHAHSLDAELRHNAMWALKHLVLEVDNDLKKQCLDELESGWLVQLICDDTEDEALFARLRRERQIRDEDEDDDNDDDEDEDMDLEGLEEESRPWLWPALYRTKSTRSTSQRSHSARVQRAERKLTALREAELNPVRKARNDDLAIQEQGLNFIRNLIGPPASSGAALETLCELAEMVDYVFNELGQDRLFEILASKLRVKVLHAFDRRHGRGRETRVLYPQPRVIEAVVCILSHMAASIPRHRQLVTAQTDLLKLLGGYFGSKDITVRRALCHLLTNLVCKDDPDDAQACAQRALELKKLGFLSKLEVLEHDDGELDVRERARSAAWSMKQMHQ